MNIFDSHAHYYDEKFGNKKEKEELIRRIKNAGITNILNVGADIETSKTVIEQAKQFDFMYASVGIHPDMANMNLDVNIIKELAKKDKVVAIGEIGLDYHYDGFQKEKQKELFKAQIQIANEANLPIIIHNRESSIDLINILKNEITANKKGVFHCCEMNQELIKQALSLGYYISFAGPITFKNAKKAKECVELVPLDRLLIETDSPYLAPEPFRGSINNSINVKIVASKIAEFKGLLIEEIAQITYKNTKRLFL